MQITRQLAAILAGAACAAAMPAQAATGTVDLLVSTSAVRHAVEMGETLVTAAGGDGTLTLGKSSGRPFVEGNSAGLRFAGWSKKTPSGLELEADGLASFGGEDTLLLVFERHADDPGAQDEGRLHLAGGTGRFAGVSGECRYRMEEPAGQWVVAAHCEWRYDFPYR